MLIVLTVLAVSTGPCLYAPAGSAARASDYFAKFRAAYLPIVTTLNRVTPACAHVTRVQQLPACGRRVAPFRVALARLLQFVTHTTPPANAKADVRTLVASIRVLQQRFTTLAAIIKRNDLARSKALGGPGHAIDNAISAFITAIGALEIDFGKRLPLPG